MPLALPSGGIYRNGRWRLVSNAARFSSPITRTVQSVARPGDFWACTFDLPALSGINEKDRIAEWAGFVIQLAGGRESAYIRPPIVAGNAYGGTPRVNGANQAGTTLLVDGFHSGSFLETGSWFCYDTSTFRMLHMVTARTVADGSGAMSIPIMPAIRKAPADNTLLNLSEPTCEMILENADVDVLSLSDAAWFSQSLSFIENVRA